MNSGEAKLLFLECKRKPLSFHMQMEHVRRHVLPGNIANTMEGNRDGMAAEYRQNIDVVADINSK